MKRAKEKTPKELKEELFGQLKKPDIPFEENKRQYPAENPSKSAKELKEELIFLIRNPNSTYIQFVDKLDQFCKQLCKEQREIDKEEIIRIIELTRIVQKGDKSVYQIPKTIDGTLKRLSETIENFNAPEPEL